MNFAHVHLILNHIPMLTMPIALIFFAYAIWKKNEDLKKFSLLILIATAATVVPAYLTGEPAEKVIEHLPSFSEDLIHAHEELAEVSLILTLAAGVISILVLGFSAKPFIRRFGASLVIVITLVAVGLLSYTANLGGQITHAEIRQEISK